ncbi:unnamed protein product [Withania somnifera]
MLNLLRANLIILPMNDHKCHLQDIDTAITDVGRLVYSWYSSMEEKEDMTVGELNRVPVLDFSGTSFHSLLPRIDGLGSIDIILDNLKEFLSIYSYSLHFQKQHDGFLYFPIQKIANAYEVEHLVVGCINRDIPEWCLEVVEIHEKKISDLELHNTIDVASVTTSQFSRITSMREEMLIRGSPELDVISIVGMAGLGKTTLANKLLLDQLVVSHFDVLISYQRMNYKLRRHLLVQRYLILVDDIWETIAWDDLKPCFCDANNGSRVVLTTRLGDVTSMLNSWMLLKNKAFNKKSCPLVLEKVGQKIAQKCGGLPLSVVLVAGILETVEKENHCWEQVAINLSPHIQAKSEHIIDLSYQNLLYPLKPCFLYFGAFLEDEEIKVSKLRWSWTAEGLNLIGRNLIMVSKKSSDGKTKACRIHDLLLDFCRMKAKMENFLQSIKGDSTEDPCFFAHQKHKFPRRLCLYFEGDNLVEWSSICSNVQSFHLMKSRHIESSSIDCTSYTSNNFKFLKVLAMEFTVIDSSPEVLTFKGIGGRVSLSDTLWRMVKLRHLHTYNRAMFTMPNVQETLASAWFSCVEDANNILANTPNLLKLRCEVLRCDGFFPHLTILPSLKCSRFLVTCGSQTATSVVWEVTGEQFPQLKFLNLQHPYILEWNVADDAFPCLELLVFERCSYLKEIPSPFADMATLKSIKVLECNDSLVESADDIGETQVEEMQNSGFKLFIQK